MIIDASSTIQEFDSKKEMGQSLDKKYPVQMQTVFEVDTGVTEWIVAMSIDEVKEFLKDQCGYSDEDLELISIEICDNDRLHFLKFVDDDGSTRSMYEELQLEINERNSNQLFNKPFSLATSEC